MDLRLITLATTFESIVDGFKGFINNLLPQDILTILIQLCSTAVIFIVVALFFFKPVRELLKARQDYVENQIKESEEANAKAKEREEVSRSIIDEAKKESLVIIDEAKKSAEEHKEKMFQETDEEIKNLKLQAELDIEREKKAAQEEIKKQIIDVAILASETVLNREVNHEDNSRLVDDFIKDINN